MLVPRLARHRAARAALLAATLTLAPRALADSHAPGQPHPLEALPAISPQQLGPALPLGQLHPLANVPQLSSRAAEPVKLYLNFTGAPAQQWGDYATTTTPAYDTDGDPTSFSDSELSQIHEVFQRVAEKYSPFNVDVTTVDPKVYPYNKVVQVVVGGDGAWTGGVFGGFGFVNGFAGATSNTAWVFSKNLGKGLPKFVAEGAAHEAGHNFGLYHQSLYAGQDKVDEYRGGRDKDHPDPVAPIMGFSYYADRGVWALGPNSNAAFEIQDDLDVLSVTSLGYRPDDHGNTALAATVLGLAEDDVHVWPASGVIEEVSDLDTFRFHSAGGLIDLNVDVAPFGPMLDLKATLADASGQQLFSADTATLGERVVALVPEGDYYLTVASHGNYGDLGQYTISGVTVPEPVSTPLIALGAAAFSLRRRARFP